MNRPQLVGIILPTVNELENLRILLPEIRAALPGAEIFIIDDASTDGSREFLRDFELHDRGVHTIFRDSRLGIGNAHIAGIRAVRDFGCEIAITMDADRTHRVEDLKLLLSTDISASLTVGSRYLPGSDIRGWSFTRGLLTRVGHLVTCMFFFSSEDMSSGLRKYNIVDFPFKAIEENCPSDYGFFFVSMLVFKRLKLSINQVPAVLENRGAGRSKMSLRLMAKGIALLMLFGSRLRRVRIA